MKDIWLLATSPKAGESIIREYELYAEANTHLDDPRNLAVADRVVSAHASIELPGSAGWRLHIASTNSDLRQASLHALYAYVERAHRLFPNLRHINMHAAPHQFPDPPVRPGRNPVPPLRSDLARWDLLVDAVRAVARRCQSLGLTLSVENNWAYWDGIAAEVSPETCDPARFVEYYCTSPEQWLQLAVDVDLDHFTMCLDPSHAAPYCHRWPAPARRQVLNRFLAHPSRLGHLHWNDSDLIDVRGRDDLHLPIGDGNLGDAFHRTLKQWASQEGHIAVLEHFVGHAALERELAYIASL
jgi:sugar phosphate isomerase/epimerase